MKVILREDVVSLGVEGEVIDVADGYARNYLIPKNLAVSASPGNLKDLEFRRKAIEKKEAERVIEIKKLAKKFDGKKIDIKVKVAEEGKLYGSVTISDVARLIKEQLGQDVDKRQIVVHDHIKETGSYPVIIRLHPQVESTLTLDVIAEEEQEKPEKETTGPPTEEEGGLEQRKPEPEKKEPIKDTSTETLPDKEITEEKKNDIPEISEETEDAEAAKKKNVTKKQSK